MRRQFLGEPPGHTTGSWPGTSLSPSVAAIAFSRRICSTVSSGPQSTTPPITLCWNEALVLGRVDAV